MLVPLASPHVWSTTASVSPCSTCNNCCALAKQFDLLCSLGLGRTFPTDALFVFVGFFDNPAAPLYSERSEIVSGAKAVPPKEGEAAAGDGKWEGLCDQRGKGVGRWCFPSFTLFASGASDMIGLACDPPGCLVHTYTAPRQGLKAGETDTPLVIHGLPAFETMASHAKQDALPCLPCSYLRPCRQSKSIP
jgi:hypothetical protein